MEKFEYKLLVEGRDDLHVVAALCSMHDVNENFDIIDCGSIDNVFKQLKLRLTNPRINKKIGIIIDADIDLEHRWRQYCSIIGENGNYNIPNNLPADGLIVETTDPGEPVIGLWVMPDNKKNGMLEDFLSFLAPGNDPLMLKTEEVLNEIEELGIHKYKDTHHAKAKIHTFLAWQKDPGSPMGQAITKRYLQPDCNMARTFTNWLKQLFIP